ncbi:LysM domain/BON superfamily protein [Marinobacterium sp. xm-d-509]|nr:LysM domain/BON superfamily protein [Marinobacterium sp. xm-g-48]NRP83979.1 LysM domain/BON superfamily protein [Marinobacterium sp. xm-d-509]
MHVVHVKQCNRIDKRQTLKDSMFKRIKQIAAVALGITSMLAQADTIKLAQDAPSEYTVVKGDTLWDISARFLKSPWLWPKVWEVNSQIYNPHLIYPGDVIYLYWEDGEPRLGRKPGTLVLTPEVKVVPREEAIASIPLRDVQAFLNDSRVVDNQMLADAPYVLGGKNQRILAANDDRVYVRGELLDDSRQQSLYRPLIEYVDPNTGESLGYELHRVADALVRGSEGDTISVDIRNSTEEVRLKDILIPTGEAPLVTRFMPRPGPELDNVEVIAVLNGVANIGQFNSVTINAGEREGIEPGSVYAIYNRGEEIRDPKTGEKLQLPAERAGELMVYKTFDKVSYALVMRATEVIQVGDPLRQP